MSYCQRRCKNPHSPGLIFPTPKCGKPEPTHTEEVPRLVKGRDVQELKELQRQGMSIQAISELTGWDRKTIRKYMKAAGVVPEYGPRAAQPSKLDAFRPYLEERLRAGVWPKEVSNSS